MHPWRASYGVIDHGAAGHLLRKHQLEQLLMDRLWFRSL